jgi:transposase InsO family protein
MLDIVEDLKMRLGEPYRSVCRELLLPYSNVMRWKEHRKNGVAVIGKPGPAKVQPPDVGAIYNDIRQLAFGKKRVQGTTALQKKYSDRISWRDFQALVDVARREAMQEKESQERRIEWLVPGFVWSMDDAKDHWLDQDRFGHIHLLQDLGSRHKLKVLGDEMLAHGDRVAENLSELFEQHGAPLFLKRDNGSNLNHHAVNAVLTEFGVIPINSPPYYPPYNGGIERAQREIQQALILRIGTSQVDATVFRLQCELSGHDVNHKRRRSLGWQTACHALEEGRQWIRLFGRRERKEVFEEIQSLAVDINEALGEHIEAATETAFRYAAETWMQLNNMIRVTRNGEVLPPFYQIWSH